ncbi:SIR2 family protein [Bacillus thuringiensis]|uniref:SIR2 family protein n=1 Tax=Bacillus thuringiensis TaxID=1428 RepID=UPI000D57B54D|nr:SIR2 family protein [Bacillus thuringiensis]MBD8075466.1 SIR2 family protein [Bacillus thuringiensis]
MRDLKDFIERLNSNELKPSERGYYFERYILLMLREYLTNDNVVFEPISSPKFRFDALVGRGFDNLQGPIGIEIKILKNSKEVLNSISQFISLIEKTIDSTTDVNTVLFIFGNEITSVSRRKIKDYIERSNITSPQIEIWDIQDLEEKFKDLEVVSKEIIDNIEYLSLNYDNKKKQDKNFNANKEPKHIESLREIYKSEGLTLFLGSGISKSSGLPIWNELIGKISVDVLSNIMNLENYLEKDLIAEELSLQLAGNPLTAANYLETGFKIRNGHSETQQEKIKFYNAIKEALYSRYEENSDNNEQMEIIAKAIVNSKKKGIYGLNKVITYNYDDLLEVYVDRISSDFLYESIYDDFNVKTDIFPIYHVHGFLPLNSTKYANYSMQEQDIIFSEESYHELQMTPYSWRNLVQINALREDVVLMLGLSVDDPNIRRLLKIISKSSEKKYYVLLKKYSAGNLYKIEKSVVNDFVEKHTSILEATFEKLGVNIIWFDNYNDLPNILLQIFNLD